MASNAWLSWTAPGTLSHLLGCILVWMLVMVFTYSKQLLTILSERRGSGLSDPGDMIVAHLGMLGEGKPPADFEAFVGNAYDKSECDLYADVALYFLNSTRCFGYLSHREDVALETRRSGLASWVSDWTSPEVPSNFGIENYPKIDDLDHSHVVVRLSTLPPVLASIGTTIGIIDVILESMPPTCDIRVWTTEFKAVKDVKDYNIVEFYTYRGQKCYQKLYKKLDDWFREHSVSRLPPVPRFTKFWEIETRICAGDLEMKEEEYGLFAFMKRCSKLLDGERSGHIPAVRQKYRNASGQNHFEASLVPWLVIGMTGVTGSGCFPGKRIAVLQDSNFAVVPELAQAGDVICRLDTLAVPYVMRKLPTNTNSNSEPNTQMDRALLSEIDIKVTQFFAEKTIQLKENYRGYLRDLDKAKIEHFNFIGECLVDTSMERHEDPISPKAAMILALH